MIIDSEESVTTAVLQAMSQGGDPRLHEIMTALVKHAHAFAREVRPTEDEFDRGIDFLIRIGKATNDRNNEGILFSDAIGFSTLVTLLNTGLAGGDQTASALLGPFWRAGSPRTANGASIVRSPTPGPAVFVNCRITDPGKKPLAGVEVDVWHSSPRGFYENQDAEQADMNLRGKFFTDADGRFGFRSVKPAGYPVPTDGPVGDMLRAQHRHPFRPAHLHFIAHHPGYKTLITQVFADDDERLDSDVVFGVTHDLVGHFKRRDDAAPDADVTGLWYSLDHDMVLEPGEARWPTPPIK